MGPPRGVERLYAVTAFWAALGLLFDAPARVSADNVDPGQCLACCRIGSCAQVLGGLTPGQCCPGYNSSAPSSAFCCGQTSDETCVLGNNGLYTCQSAYSISTANIIIAIIAVVVVLIVLYLIYDWYRKHKHKFEFQVEAMMAESAQPTEHYPTEDDGSGKSAEARTLEKPLQDLGWSNLEIDNETGMFVLSDKPGKSSVSASTFAAPRAPH